MDIPRSIIAAAQISPKLGDLKYNLQLHLAKARQAAELGADIIIFPELSLTGYLLKDLTPDVAQSVESSDLIDELRAESEKIAILVGFVEEADNYVYYNSAAFLDQGEIVYVHRKVYLPTYGMFDEERYFSPGGNFRAFDTRFGRAAILICEDYWHPSSVYLAAQDGAVLHFYTSNAPQRGLTLTDEITSADIAERMSQVSSQIYGLYTAYSNRIGYEDGICFSGCSRIIGPTGSVLARAGSSEEELIMAEIDPEQIRRSRVFFPLLGDEKIDLVHRELSRIRSRRYRLENDD